MGFQDQISLNAGQKYCIMLQGEHSAIVSTFIKLALVIKIVFCLCLSDRLRQVLLLLITILVASSCTHMRICVHEGTPLKTKI